MGFNIGQRVTRRSTGEIGRIFGGPTEAGYYDVQFIEDDELVPASDLEGMQAGDLGPLELLKQGRFGVAEEHDLYVRAAVLNHAFQYDSRSGLSNARIEPKLWQLFVMLRVLHKTTPRMILADEVGLGKTVEAGLLIKELKARKLAERVLVITPASLVEQWRQELASKFNESFEIFNAPAIDYLSRGGRKNPWYERDNIICSLQFALRHEQEITDSHWDLVIIDEAHKVSRRRHGKSWETKKTYDFAVELKGQTQGLLLLTATPMQVHPSQLYSLIDLVEPGMFGSIQQFMAQVTELPKLNDLMKAVQGCARCTPDEQEEILEGHTETLKRLGLDAEDLLPLLGDAQGRETALIQLAALHPMADVMVRNRKREVLDGLTKRRPITHMVEATATELELYDEITEYIRASYNVAIAKKDRAVGFLMVAFQKMLTSSSAAIKASFEKRAEKLEAILAGEQEPPIAERLTEDDLDELRDAEEASEAIQGLLGAEFGDLEEADFRAAVLDEIASLREFVERLGREDDSKALMLVEAVKNLLREDPSEKVLIFTQFIETQMYLAELLERAGFSVEYFNGSMKLEEKEKAVRKFRDSAQVLVSTESGGEGRNFQFCHVMVNYDLPWNPMRVEQRIGRIDRIGQKRDVVIHNLAVLETLEERILRVLDERIRMFEESVGSLDPILGEIEREFEQLAMSGALLRDSEREAFEIDVDRRRREALANEEVQQDLAMDRSSFRRDEANEWLERRPLAEWSDLRDFVGTALDYFGGRMSTADSGVTVVAVSPGLRADIGVAKARYEGEFDPAAALEDEPDEFFAIGHEVVDGLLKVAGKRDGRQCSAFAEAGLSSPEIEIWYELLSRAGRPTGRMVQHRVGEWLEVQSRLLEAFPPLRAPARNPDLPGWVADAVQKSRDHLERVDLAEFRDEVAVVVSDYREAELARIKRIHEHTVERLTLERQRLESQIRELKESGTEKQKRILPAREGALRKLETRTQDERIAYEKRVCELEELAPDHSSKVVAATLVVPQ